jgi:hypothetical protein
VAVRAYVYAVTKLTGQPFFVYAHGSGRADGINVGVFNGDPASASNWTFYNRTSGMRGLLDTTAPVDAERWYCVEMVMRVQSSAGALSNTVDLFVDRNALGRRVFAGGEATNIIDEVDVGITWAESGANNEFALDDVVIADRPIGCE